MVSNGQFQQGRLGSLLEAVDAAVLTIDELGTVLEANQATSRLFGHALDTLIGQNVKVLMPSPYRQEHDGYLSHHVRTGETRIIGQGRRVEGKHASGKIFPIHLSVARFEESGRTYYTGIIHDLTELARVESESQKLERIIDECINEVYTFHRESLLVTSANRAARDNLGYSSADIRTLTPYDFIAGIRRDTFEHDLQRLKRADVQYLGFDEQFIRQDGSAYQAEVQIYYLSELEPPEFAAVAFDVTDRNMMLESLRQSQKMESIGNLTGGIAHDFNNILSVVLGNTELLTMGDCSDEQKELLTEITDAVHMGSRLTGRLLAFARRKSLSPELIDLNQLIAGLQDMLERLLDSPIQLQVRLSDRPCWVNVDVSEFENALVNLIVNARDAMPGGGKVQIRTSANELPSVAANDLTGHDMVTLTVSDTGNGIDPAIRDRIFEPFVSTKSASHGSGLGLSMVYGFVSQSGGDITCQSDPATGTQFVISLPYVTEPSVSLTEQSAKAETPEPRRLNVLVVEDDDRVRRLTIKRFERLGHQVASASNGHQALEVIRQDAGITFVFTDVVMTEGMTGYELATTIRQLRPELPVLLTSGYAEEAISEAALADSGLLLLAKPYEQQELEAAINTVLLNWA